MHPVRDPRAGVTPRPENSPEPGGFPDAIRPILGRWPLVDRLGRRAAWRVLMAREAYDLLPPDSRPEACLDEGGTLVFFDVGAGARAPAPPVPGPDLRGLSFHGRIHGERATVLVTSADWHLIPADRKPAALVERAGAWYAVFSLDLGGLLR